MPTDPSFAEPGDARGVLLDGPMGTELARRGLSLPPPAWSALALVGAPDLVCAIHRDYAHAGATVHTANTFRTQRRSVGARWEELARLAVRLARESTQSPVSAGARIAGSLAPLQDCYRPDLSPGEGARAEHRAMARALASAGADILLCETFAAPIEATVAVEEAARTGLETWVSLTAGPDATLLTPAAMRDAARDCVEAGARAVIVGCTRATATLPFVQALAEAGIAPGRAVLGVRANVGDASEGLGWNAAPAEAADRYAALAASWLDAGATRIGACCGAGPAHIARLGALLERRSERVPWASERPSPRPGRS